MAVLRDSRFSERAIPRGLRCLQSHVNHQSGKIAPFKEKCELRMRRGVAASDKRGGFIGDPSKGVEGIRPSEKKLPCQNNNNGGLVGTEIKK